MYETAKETLMYRSVLWTLWERERVGRFGRMSLKHVPETIKLLEENIGRTLNDINQSKILYDPPTS